MADHAYFVQLRNGEPAALWRRDDDEWDFFSFLDWTWHRAVPGVRPRNMPEPESLRPSTGAEAESLAADRQRWVEYWAWRFGGEARSVVRRRRSPELLLDESYTFDNTWERTEVLIDIELGDPSNPEDLVKINQPTAERILREVRGVEGATQL